MTVDLRVLAVLAALLCGAAGRGQEVSSTVSAASGQRLTSRPPLHFEPGSNGDSNTFELDEAHTFQVIGGFGASFLEAGLVCLNTLPAQEQEKVLEALFEPKTGAGFSAMKTPIAGTDFMSAGPYYTYDDSPGDVELKNFSIARDLQTNGVITYIRRARKYGSFVLQAPMDYPPDWMLVDARTNQNVNPKYYDALAHYYARYVQAYEKEGISVDYVSLFNEPGIYTKIPYRESRELFNGHVAPMFARLGLKTRLVLAEPPCRECAWNEFSELLDGRTRRNSAAIAFHGYNFNKFETLSRLHSRFPELPLWMTEVCHSVLAGTYKKLELPCYDFEDGDFWANQIFSDMEAGVSAWIYWNMILDEKGGPWMISDIHGDPDKNVQHPLVIINRQTHEVFYTGAYWYLAHFSKFVRPGMVRIAVEGQLGKIRCVAFMSPDRRIVAQVLNSERAGSHEVVLRWRGKHLKLSVPPISITTCEFAAR